MKLILLTNTGKCGTLFIQRLFDGHPLVITFPFAFNFYYAWSKLLSPEDHLTSFVNKLLDFTSLKEVLQYVNREQYLKRIRDHLPNDFDIKKDRKELLEALHLAYNFLVSKNRKATHILLNTINVNYLDMIQEDYPTHNHIFLIRDPKNSYAAFLSSDQSHDPVYRFQFLRNTLHNAAYVKMFVKKHQNQVNFLKIEDLNEDLTSTIKGLCRWLQINFSDVLLKESINEKPLGNSSVKLSQRKMSTKIRNTRWVHSLGATEVVLIEFLHNELIKEHYAFTSNQFLRTRFMAIFLLLLPNWKQTSLEPKSQNSQYQALFHTHWLITRLNWFRLIRAVCNKNRLQL